jgi:FkbM family methyltransferase
MIAMDLSNASPIGRVIRLPLRLVPKQAIVRTLSGPNRGARWIVGSGVHGYWLGIYELQTRRFLESKIRTGMVIYDVGAHVGYYTLMASRLVGPGGRVVAFEPNPSNISFLRRHLGLNGVDNVTVIEAAVSSMAGTAHFDAGGEPSMGHLASTGSLEVKLVTIDAIADELDLRPNLIKVDVEGHEPPALEGAMRSLVRDRPGVFLSVGPDTRPACEAALASCGYRWRPLTPSMSSELECEPIQRD